MRIYSKLYIIGLSVSKYIPFYSKVKIFFSIGNAYLADILLKIINSINVTFMITTSEQDKLGNGNGEEVRCSIHLISSRNFVASLFPDIELLLIITLMRIFFWVSKFALYNTNIDIDQDTYYGKDTIFCNLVKVLFLGSAIFYLQPKTI